MTKTDLVNYIAEETGLTKADATRALDAMMNGVIKGLKGADRKVALTGFVTFTAKDKEAKKGTYLRLPERRELNQEINEALVVEFYNR